MHAHARLSLTHTGYTVDCMYLLCMFIDATLRSAMFVDLYLNDPKRFFTNFIFGKKLWWVILYAVLFI